MVVQDTPNRAPADSPPRVALATCADLPELDADDRPLLSGLARRGVGALAAVWDDPQVDWAGFDLVVIRSTWDYPGRRQEFLTWAAAVPRLANPIALVRWNTDKRYLADLSAAGVPVVPSVFVDPSDGLDATAVTALLHDAASTEVVVKPTVGAGARDAARYDLTHPDRARAAAAHVLRLVAAGRAAMVQPYQAGVDTAGETGLVHVGGAFSHAFAKAPLLSGDDPEVTGLFRPERISPAQATPDQLAVARIALEAVADSHPDHQPLYARVDLVPGVDGHPVVLEIELTEPSLFLAQGPGAADRFADAIAALVTSS